MTTNRFLSTPVDYSFHPGSFRTDVSCHIDSRPLDCSYRFCAAHIDYSTRPPSIRHIFSALFHSTPTVRPPSIRLDSPLPSRIDSPVRFASSPTHPPTPCPFDDLHQVGPHRPISSPHLVPKRPVFPPHLTSLRPVSSVPFFPTLHILPGHPDVSHQSRPLRRFRSLLARHLTPPQSPSGRPPSPLQLLTSPRHVRTTRLASTYPLSSRPVDHSSPPRSRPNRRITPGHTRPLFSRHFYSTRPFAPLLFDWPDHIRPIHTPRDLES
jgi:hypothetical protein